MCRCCSKTLSKLFIKQNIINETGKDERFIFKMTAFLASRIYPHIRGELLPNLEKQIGYNFLFRDNVATLRTHGMCGYFENTNLMLNNIMTRGMILSLKRQLKTTLK